MNARILFCLLTLTLPAAAQPEDAPARTQPPAPALTEPPDALWGQAAPPTAAGTTPLALELRPGLEVFAQYAYRRTLDEQGASTWYHEFEVPRVHLALGAEVDDASGRVVVEAVRSASEGALIGVAGDSLVIRVREAYGAYRYDWLQGFAGVIPTLVIPELEGTWRLRAVTPDPLEATGLGSPADVGAGARVTIPGSYGWVGVAAYNGEGYTNRELNRGKNAEAAAAIHPLPQGPLRPLAILAAYQLGSSGTGLARADRATGALLWQGDLLRGGLSFTYAWGLGDDGAQRSYLVDAFLRAQPIERVLLGIRGSHWLRDTRSDPIIDGADAVSWVTGTAGYELSDPLSVFAAFTRSLPTDRARSALPDADYWEGRLVTRVVF